MAHNELLGSEYQYDLLESALRIESLLQTILDELDSSVRSSPRSENANITMGLSLDRYNQSVLDLHSDALDYQKQMKNVIVFIAGSIATLIVLTVLQFII